MKKVLKTTLKIIIVIVIIYCIFITEEFIRISTNHKSKPLIVLKEKDTYYDTAYMSISFYLKNRYHHISNDLVVVNSQELWLFNKILI